MKCIVSVHCIDGAEFVSNFIDWLDNGNNKKAVQEADKVLKKQPELLCAQVIQIRCSG